MRDVIPFYPRFTFTDWSGDDCIVFVLLDDPNADDPAQVEPYVLYRYARAEYDRRVREQASSFSEEHFNQLARQYCRPAPYGVRYTECGQHRIVRGVRG